MFSAVQSFISRHRRKFILGGIVIGGVVLISDYAKRVLREAQEKETKEILERNSKHQHYESTEEICNKTALRTAQTLNSKIAEKLKAAEILDKLKSKGANKVQLWEQLMVLSFTKVAVMVYASSLVMILLRIQLNLVGGYIFRDGADGTKQVGSNTQIEYLSLYNNLMENGIHQLITLIGQKVKSVLKNKSLKSDMTVKDIEKIFWAIQSSVSGDDRDPCKTISKYCMLDELDPTTNGDCKEPKALHRIVDETRDILESREIHTLAESAVVSGFALVMDELSEYFTIKCNSLKDSVKNSAVASTSANASPSSSSGDLIDLSGISLPMARVIPMVNALVPDTYKKPIFAESLMLRLVLMDSLKAMGANVYELFSSNF